VPVVGVEDDVRLDHVQAEPLVPVVVDHFLHVLTGVEDEGPLHEVHDRVLPLQLERVLIRVEDDMHVPQERGTAKQVSMPRVEQVEGTTHVDTLAGLHSSASSVVRSPRMALSAPAAFWVEVPFMTMTADGFRVRSSLKDTVTEAGRDAEISVEYCSAVFFTV
jgi:hypothetical protein